MSQHHTPERVVAERLAELRQRRGWSQAELADRMAAYGIPWGRTTPGKIENRQRNVTVEELVGLAFVLGVSPVALMVPTAVDTEVRLTPNTSTSGPNAYAWMSGALPMGGTRPGDELSVGESLAMHRLYDEAGPDHLATAERRLPGTRRLARLAANVTTAAGVPEAVWPQSRPGIVALLVEVEASAKELRERLMREAAAEKKGARK
jgi:transcriptional regulator with XRE-family HTH domain